MRWHTTENHSENQNIETCMEMWPNELPIEGKPEDVTKAVSEYNQKLQLSNIPKLLIYGEPGGIITKPMVDWCVKNLSNLKTANIGARIHYLQEDNAHGIDLEIAKWYETMRLRDLRKTQCILVSS
jgi:haloalkane dehalogenase